jgi:hypothetical protein
MAQGFIDSIEKIVDLKSQGIFKSFNDIDIDQHREHLKVSCHSCLARMMKAHGRDNPFPTKKSESSP